MLNLSILISLIQPVIEKSGPLIQEVTIEHLTPCVKIVNINWGEILRRKLRYKVAFVALTCTKSSVVVQTFPSDITIETASVLIADPELDAKVAVIVDAALRKES
jgi:hypothetical protein